MKTRFLGLFISCLVLLFAVSCASKAPSEPMKAYSAAMKESSIVSVATLKQWVDNGLKTDSGRRVIIIDVEEELGDNVIPGTLHFPYSSYFYEERSDGLITVGDSVPSGEGIDEILQMMGYTINDTIVLTGEWNDVKGITKVWWDLKYWGFSNAQVKILDGGTAAFRVFYPATMVKELANAKLSKFSVKDLQVDVIDRYRASFAEVFEGAKDGTFIKGEKLLISTFNYINVDGKNFPQNGVAYTGLIDGSKQIGGGVKGYNQDMYIETKTYKGKSYKVFIDADKLMSLMGDANNGNLNVLYNVVKNKRIITHCIGGYSTAVPNFLIQERLGFTNVAIYDGSFNEWTALSAYKAKDMANVTDPASVSNKYVLLMDGKTRMSKGEKYSFWNPLIKKFLNKDGNDISYVLTKDGSNLEGNLRWDTVQYSTYPIFKLYLEKDAKGNANYTYKKNSSVTPDYKGKGDEINKADKLYIKQ